MSTGEGSSSLAGKLAKYAYSPSPSPRKSGVKVEASTPQRRAAVDTRTPTPLRRSARKSTSRSPYFEPNEYDSDELSEPFDYEVSDGGPPSPTRAVTKTTLKRRGDGTLEKFGWKRPRGFADPEKYAHLPLVQDCMLPELDLIFCGINPGQRSSRVGHHFAHPTNKFWRALHLSGLTPRLLTPQEDTTLPGEYGYGLTNLVPRPTAEQAELSSHEMRLAVEPLVRKFVDLRAGVVCFVGKKIWDIFAGVAGKSAKLREKAEATEAKRRAKEAAVKREVQSEVPEAKITMCTLEDGLVKLEPEAEDEAEAPGLFTPRKGRPDPYIELISRTPSTTPSRPATPSTPKSKAFAFDKPQPLRLLLPDDKNAKWTHTYFWVVPNTSGLERTPLSGTTEYFAALKTFVAILKAGDPLPDTFTDFTLDEVKSIVASIAHA